MDYSLRATALGCAAFPASFTIFNKSKICGSILPSVTRTFGMRMVESCSRGRGTRPPARGTGVTAWRRSLARTVATRSSARQRVRVLQDSAERAGLDLRRLTGRATARLRPAASLRPSEVVRPLPQSS